MDTRIAVLYDIHGNLPALEAVLEEIAGESVEQIVVGGDVFPGPMSHDCLECLLAVDLPVRFIRGNGERVLLELAAGGAGEEVPEPHRGAMRWEAERLDGKRLALLESWPASLRVRLEGAGEVLFCHATPRNDTEIFTRLTAEQRLLDVFAPAAAALVLCGHTHMQFDRQVGESRVVNAGSVGMPFGEAGAYWLLLAPDVQLRRTGYDREAAAARIRATDHPGAADFAASNVLRAPSEQEMLELFSGAELRP